VPVDALQSPIIIHSPGAPGETWSTRRAADSTIRHASQLEQETLGLQEKATRRSWRQPSHLPRRKPVFEQNAIELVFGFLLHNRWEADCR
jgi:hypothetical protein